jgi:hypothetical protein
MTSLNEISYGKYADDSWRIIIGTSNIVTAFNASTIGTKVLATGPFIDAVANAMMNHDWSSDKIPGQGFIHVPEAIRFVSGGIGKSRNNPDDYVLRSHRGKVHAYLRREFAEPVTDCHVVVYTSGAYLADPDIGEDPGEAERIHSGYDTHILVAVLADSGAPSTLSPYRFVKNLAGGNHEALAWSADEIRAKAREIAANVDVWSVVAD